MCWLDLTVPRTKLDRRCGLTHRNACGSLWPISVLVVPLHPCADWTCLCLEPSFTCGEAWPKGTLEVLCNPYLYLWSNFNPIAGWTRLCPGGEKLVLWVGSYLVSTVGFLYPRSSLACQLPMFVQTQLDPVYSLTHLISNMYNSHVYKSTILHLFTLNEHYPNKGEHPPSASHPNNNKQHMWLSVTITLRVNLEHWWESLGTQECNGHHNTQARINLRL